MKKLLLIACILGLAACSGSNGLKKLDGDKAFFSFDSAAISPAAKENLLEQSLYMKKHKDVNIVLEGHCDERGSVEYNLALGALRAGNAAHTLMKDGIKAERIKTISYGKEKPQFKGTGEAIWTKNRNVTTRVAK